MKQDLKRIYIAVLMLCALTLSMSLTTWAEQGEAICEHVFGEYELVTEPNCTQKGEAVRTCITCGYKESIVVTRPGHVLGDWVMDTASQIGVAGSMSRSCTVCGDVVQTEAIAALPEPEPAPEPQAPSAPEEHWIDVPLPLALAVCILPNLVLVAVLIIRRVRKHIEKIKL